MNAELDRYVKIFDSDCVALFPLIFTQLLTFLYWFKYVPLDLF